MKKRILHIGIASREYIHKRLLDIAAGRLQQRDEEPQVWFTSWESLAGVLSRQNMMLIEILRDTEPESVTELAKLVKREKTNVLRDLKKLKAFSIVDFEEGKGNRKPPRLIYNDFRPLLYPRDKAA